MHSRPNILYLHSHDTGRHVQPYGYRVPTPNIQAFAAEGTLFRQAFCAAPSCSGSRACLLTGQWAHSNGMIGLAHRGFELRDSSRHLAHTLHAAGYWCALVGVQHEADDARVLGYDRVVETDTTHVESVAPAAASVLADLPERPFFLSVGFLETHRAFREPTSEHDALYSLPPANVPDTPETRRDMASFNASARSLDEGVGAVLDALEKHGPAGDTLVILTTDHGLAFPGAKATLYDRGIGVLLIMRGPGGFDGGRASDALISQIDLYPTICELAGVDPPPFVQGTSMLPLIGGAVEEINDAIFAELTFHAAYEPQRAIRTQRFKYIRRFGERERPVLANVDDGPSKDLLIDAGWADQLLPREELHDLLLDPQEAHDLARDPAYAPVRDELRGRLAAWMCDTGDPLVHGDVPVPPGAWVDDPDERSAGDWSPVGAGH